MPTRNNFYPRPPGGGRHSSFHWAHQTAYRISIHALRVEGDDANYYEYNPEELISIHALRVEGDPLPFV